MIVSTVSFVILPYTRIRETPYIRFGLLFTVLAVHVEIC